MSCKHLGRAIGEVFERCLVCGSWRVHLYGVTKFKIDRRWWPSSLPMPKA